MGEARSVVGRPNLGFHWLAAEVEEITGRNALVIDQFGRRLKVKTEVRQGAGRYPRVGERWVIDRNLGFWSFVAVIKDDPPNVGGANYGIPALVNLLQDLEDEGHIVDLTTAGVAPVVPPTWQGNLVATFGRGDPNDPHLHHSGLTVAQPTPTNIGTTVGRLREFEIPAEIEVERVRWWGIGVVANLYRLAIYNAAGNRVIWVNPLDTTLNVWGSFDVNPAVVLPEGVYWVGIAASSTGTTAGLRTPGAPITGMLDHTAKPGNLGLPMGFARYAQVPLTGGAWPETLPTLQAPAFQAGSTGTVPIVFLDANDAA